MRNVNGVATLPLSRVALKRTRGVWQREVLKRRAVVLSE